MTESRPVGYLLSGLPGSGKTTYSKELERKGVTRLSVDEAMNAVHGRLGKDYPAEQHLDLLPPVLAEVEQRLAELIGAGHSVVFDHGLGQRAQRDHYKQLITDHGGTWRLIYFQIDYAELLRRNLDRNTRDQYGVITPETLAWMADVEERPVDEGEERPDLS